MSPSDSWHFPLCFFGLDVSVFHQKNSYVPHSQGILSPNGKSSVSTGNSGKKGSRIRFSPQHSVHVISPRDGSTKTVENNSPIALAHTGSSGSGLAKNGSNAEELVDSMWRNFRETKELKVNVDNGSKNAQNLSMSSDSSENLSRDGRKLVHKGAIKSMHAYEPLQYSSLLAKKGSTKLNMRRDTQVVRKPAEFDAAAYAAALVTHGRERKERTNKPRV